MASESSFRPHPDRYLLQIFGSRCQGASDLQPFIAFLDAQGLAIDQLILKPARKTRYGAEALKKLFAEASGPRLMFALVHSAPTPAIHIDVTFARDRGIAISSYLPDDALREPVRCADELGHALAGLDILSGRCHSFADMVRAGDTTSTDVGWQPRTIDNVYWLNWYGRAFVEQVGRERVRTTPAATLTELSDGSVLWTTSASPTDFASDSSRIAQAKARCHLVDGLDFDAELERLLERSRSLVPVQPAWHPDLDQVMGYIANPIRPPSQSDLVAEVNALGLRPVDEVRPAASVSSDVDDPADAIETYQMYAEQLVALLHDKVKGIGRFDPADLPELDGHFWSYRYPEVFPKQVEESLIPAVGGYLGELLVRRFGGRWVPRQNRDETAVVIGERAWLPFVRAREYLVNRQAAVHASLTHFVREIERTGWTP